MRLECGSCVVRSWRRGDEEDLVRHANNRKVWLQLRDRFPHPYTPADADAWLAHVLAERPETNFAIALDDAVVGGIGFERGGDIERLSAEVGYWLGEEVWGRGLATAALRAVTRHAFEAHGLHRVFAMVFARNLASARVLEKVGFVREGILRRSAVKDGVVLDRILYAMVREEMDRLGSRPGADDTRLR
jgi:RimJ/RimL family protein N-acetyltransferase